jgi:hypothetical protein
LLSILLAHPEAEFHVLHLVQLTEKLDPESIGRQPVRGEELKELNIEGGLDPLLDDRAKREYADVIASLKEQIEEADQRNESARARELRDRLQWFLREWKRAVGFRGKDRPVADTEERARTKVRKNFKAALDVIRPAHASLGDYLEKRVKTGRFCSYNPDPNRAVSWAIQ